MVSLLLRTILCQCLKVLKFSYLSFDTISHINRLLIRMGSSAENICIFPSRFYQKLSGLDGYSGVARWSKNVDIFTKDIIMIPINHSECHWTLYVIINPGKVGYQMSDNRGTDIEVKPPFCLYMDSYGYPNQFHDQILLYLNKEAERLKKLSSSEKNMPFTTESLPCYVPEGKYKHNLFMFV
jgi:Ulp1 family protease